ncbi:MAG: 4Fe-4S dicluster domain-containing protein [Chloroflexi bacterium]|nr:4Fe-4S dicluster domain-containing protein [Chloroflexota bacterium]
MANWGMVIDLDKCVGCQACSLACKAENNVPYGSPGEQKRHTDIFWHKVIAASRGEYPSVNVEIIPMPCMHCEHPSCVKVCPAKATFKREDGIVMQNFRRCIGCRYCIVACPYGARSFNFKDQVSQEYQRPDLPVDLGLDDESHIGPWPYPHRTRGVVEKCTYCFHRIDQGIMLGKKIGGEGGVVPACVEACPTRARFFGDLDDPESEVSQLLARRDWFHLRDNKGTEPKTTYLPK